MLLGRDIPGIEDHNTSGVRKTNMLCASVYELWSYVRTTDDLESQSDDASLTSLVGRFHLHR
jgi:hypothetical protein